MIKDVGTHITKNWPWLLSWLPTRTTIPMFKKLIANRWHVVFYYYVCNQDWVAHMTTKGSKQKNALIIFIVQWRMIENRLLCSCLIILTKKPIYWLESSKILVNDLLNRTHISSYVWMALLIWWADSKCVTLIFKNAMLKSIFDDILGLFRIQYFVAVFVALPTNIAINYASHTFVQNEKHLLKISLYGTEIFPIRYSMTSFQHLICCSMKKGFYKTCKLGLAETVVAIFAHTL